MPMAVISTPTMVASLRFSIDGEKVGECWSRIEVPMKFEIGL